MNNPFFYIEANKLKKEELINYFIDEYNHNEFIRSSKNVFLIGERGSGKSMVLMYNSFPFYSQMLKMEHKEIDYSNIGIYIQITSALFDKNEYELLKDDIKKSLIAEHYLVLVISIKLIENILLYCPEIIKTEDLNKLRKKLLNIFEIDAGENDPFEVLHEKLMRIQVNTQDILSKLTDTYPTDSLSFFSFLIPLIDVIKSLKCFSDTHFNFLIDDAQNLNNIQKRLLNSWVAYRDHSDYSLKISITRPEEYIFLTTTDGSILEGHDYIARYTEGRFQNKLSDFGILANKIIKKRIELFGLKDITPEQFFPMNSGLEKDLSEFKQKVYKEAEAIYEKDDKKKINDYVYKYARAEYFRNRDPQANKPPYSGFEIITNLSTGILRSLLEPCFRMFDRAKDEYDILLEKHIEPDIQENIIQDLSQQKWNSITEIMPTSVLGCTVEKANQILQLFVNLGDLFRSRLLDKEASEPRAISFTISAIEEISNSEKEILLDLLRIARIHGILFKRLSSAKQAGKFEVYYTPHRMLWPIKGLDPVGQHARVSIRAKLLLEAALKNVKIPYNRKDLENETNNIIIQKPLFDNY
ncbi:MAG: hypothetical protein PHN88_07375 [Ignavibacteria bacterium]|nr:hypothetical protein [Ignavibacteria bacterium]